jgi:hypothetical protein
MAVCSAPPQRRGTLWKSWTRLFDPNWGEKATGKELILSYIYSNRVLLLENQTKLRHQADTHAVSLRMLVLSTMHI